MTMNKQQRDELKSVKQRLSAIQLVIKKSIKDGQLPQMADSDHFMTTSKQFDRLCPNEWRTAMDAFMDRLGQFQISMEGGNLEEIDEAFHGLLDCKVSCHKEFRPK